MSQGFVLTLDNEPVRFTPDGKVAVLDAIKAVSDSKRPGAIWENMKMNHPDILIHCEDYSFQENGSVSVVDSKGWEKIWILLPRYLVDSSR